MKDSGPFRMPPGESSRRSRWIVLPGHRARMSLVVGEGGGEMLLELFEAAVPTPVQVSSAEAGEEFSQRFNQDAWTGVGRGLSRFAASDSRNFFI